MIKTRVIDTYRGKMKIKYNDNKQEETIDNKEKDNNMFNKNENKIIIRDPKHSEYRFFNGIYKIGSSYTTKVELTDNAGNVSTINCNLNNKLVRKIVNDKNGNQCLEGYTCYKQRDYRDAKLDKYQATSSGVGTISSSGCCPTSMTIAVDYFGKKDKSGNEYWLARELQKALEYKDWRNFNKVVEKAIISSDITFSMT